MDFSTTFFEQIAWGELGLAALRILLILVVFWIVMAAATIGLRRLEQVMVHRRRVEGELPSEAAKRVETLVYLLHQGVTVLLWTVAILVILGQLGVNIGPVLASAGIVGLAVGFGAQNLVRDVISGFFMILENQIGVGDVAVVNGTGGLVEHVNFRTIVLRDETGTVHIFPNGTVTTLANLTREWSGYVFNVGVAYKEDTDRVIEVMKQVGAELRADEKFGPLLVEDIDIFGVDSFADSAVMIKGRIKTRPIQQWSVGREFLRRLKKAFDREGIEMPFPQRAIYFGEESKSALADIISPEQGQAPAEQRDKLPKQAGKEA